MGPPVLFLDFDGVTHPELRSTAELFKCLPKIEEVLRHHQDVDVVISSSWRVHHPLEELRGHFSPEIARRVIDCTPVYTQHKCKPAAKMVRQIECLNWLDSHRPGSPWVALDDVPWQFEVGCANLLLTNHRTGFSSADAVYLQSVLERLK